MPVPYSFGAATSAIPLSQLDANFNTPITLGNTAIQLGNTVTTLNNMTLANVTISSGNVTITNVTVTTANATTVNTTTLIATTANVTTGNVTNLISGNVSLTGGSITGTPISGSTGSFTTLTTSSTVTLNGGTANGVAYLNASNVLTTGSALTFDGTNLGVGATASALSTYRGAEFAGTTATTGGFLRMRTSDSSINSLDFTDSNGRAIFTTTNHPIRFGVNDTEQMRLTSTGLGIGTSSPAFKLDVNGRTRSADFALTANTNYYHFDNYSGSNFMGLAGGTSLQTYVGGALRTTLDASGNLGLGVTPSAWGSAYKAMQIGSLSGMSLMGYSGAAEFGNNFYFDTAYRYAASTSASRYTQGGGAHAWYIAGSGTAGNAITFTQAMTLDASGRLGIGETSPSQKLTVGATADASNFVRVQSSTAIGIFGVDAGGGYVGTDNAYALRLFTNNTERARIDSSGNLLVGRTSYGGSATGIDLGKDGSVISYSSASTSASNGFSMYSNGASAYRFYVNWAGTIFATSTTITAISDQRLKENIQDIDVGLDAIMALKPRKFDWKSGKGKNKKGDRGWIAQEFEQVFPDMIDTWADPAPEGEESYKAVNADLIPVLVKAIQELKAEVDSLKAQLKGA